MTSTRAKIAGGAILVALLALTLMSLYRSRAPSTAPTALDPRASTATPVVTSSPAAPATAADQGFLYGRITTIDGSVLEGRLRWGRGEEAAWGDFFNGAKRGNPWVAHMRPEQIPTERRPLEIFGIEIANRERQVNLGRQLMARFGDIARIEGLKDEVRVTLKSGTAIVLDRFEASDFDDDVRVWDRQRGAVDLDTLQIRSIEFLPTVQLGAVPGRLQGTVRTRRGDFTGFVQWDREKGLGDDELHGRTAEGEVGLRFDAIRSIGRRPNDGLLVTQLDGREIQFADAGEDGPGSRGIYVDDPRYGRILVAWDAFERLDFTTGDSGPAYGDFPPGHQLAGSVTTRDDRRLTGRLVYDLDESESTETLDAPSEGVDYTLPFGMVASIALPARDAPENSLVKVTLRSGEELQLERSGDLGERNAGLLVFVNGNQRAEYVPWVEVQQIVFDGPMAVKTLGDE